MCFNKEMTGGFSLFSTLCGTWILLGRGMWKELERWQRFRLSMVFFYFALMEGLQFLQYFVIDQCESKLNILWTQLGYYHICFQPLFSNLAFWALDRKCAKGNARYKVWTFVFYFCVVTGCLMALRMLVPSVFPGLIPIFGPDLMRMCDDSMEGICGPRTCSYTGTYHIRWTFKLLRASYVFPSLPLHCLNMFFVPTLLGMFWPALVLFLTGPGLALLFRPVTDGELAAIWCFFSIAETTLTVVSHYFVMRVMAKKNKTPRVDSKKAN
jgi:hypothetical protein